MNTTKQNRISNVSEAASTSLRAYAANDGYKSWVLIVIILLALGGVAAIFAQSPGAPGGVPSYQITNLASLGGTNAGGNSLNDRGWVGGFSTVSGDLSRHATVWHTGSIMDLGTLGGPNSSIAWNVKNTRGILAGIAQTAMSDPLGEAWSSAAFYGPPDNVGFINLGFVWQHGQMRALSTLGGNNGFATGANDHGIVVGWAENTCVDGTCVPPQVLQFRPVFWDTNNHDQIHEFPLYAGDTSGSATAINDAGQAVGISGICDQAVGRYTAAHAVLWQNGQVTNLGNLGADYWNTPTAINQHGDVVGFAGVPGDVDGVILRAFIWTKENGLHALGSLPGHPHTEAYGINERRQVVGLACDPDFVDCRAFIWENGVMKDLNDFKPSTYTDRLERARDINDAGEITGRAIDDSTGVRSAYIAKP
ncbi:MAG: hypothetical protein H0X40_16915 [Chthoniobacterales bacterium]|nr:hypothetical protein [Chthoniobacterales bacterium]